ncbi:MAG: hypothetical protein ACRD21_13265 [Vicinamibacteria bacterium]
MHHARLRVLTFIFLIAISIGGTALESDAQVLVGGRAGAYIADGDPFIGGEVLVGVEENLFLNPNVEYVFAENASKATFNFDLHYDFARRGRAFFWLGGGLAVIYVDPDGPPDSRTDAGANILFGVGFRTPGRRWVPYIQAKILAAEEGDFILGFGVRF